MTIEQRNAAIADLLRDYASKHTGTHKAAWDSLVSLGVYTDDGKLAAEYGGTATSRKPAAKSTKVRKAA